MIMDAHLCGIALFREGKYGIFITPGHDLKPLYETLLIKIAQGKNFISLSILNFPL
jgi:hypothetical protein